LTSRRSWTSFASKMSCSRPIWREQEAVSILFLPYFTVGLSGSSAISLEMAIFYFPWLLGTNSSRNCNRKFFVFIAKVMKAVFWHSSKQELTTRIHGGSLPFCSVYVSSKRLIFTVKLQI
jgi:hypothetical protein